jgi:hypothetical protein
MPAKKQSEEASLVREWPLPTAATLGSTVRAKGLLFEIRAHLPFKVRRSLDVRAGVLVLGMPEDRAEAFAAVAALVEDKFSTIVSTPVLPREIEDILSIKTSERHRWLKDGRLTSSGTKTVKLRGRAKQITFHVYDPGYVEQLLDTGLVDEWREDDALAKAERREQRVRSRRLFRVENPRGDETSTPSDAEAVPELEGWSEFARDNLLR